MPAILEDPTAPHVTPPATQAVLQHRTVILKDHVTVATIIPVTTGPQSVPHGLVSFLHREFNNELERGDTYPLDTPMTLENFQNYWFGTFAAVMLLGNEPVIQEGRDWQKDVLGTFYVKPNYPGRSSHICNGGFLVCHSARGKGVGKLLGEAYLDYAPKLNYTYSVFNLVYETNVASTKIWDSLGFKRIGIIKGAGRLKGHPNPVDAIIFGRELGEDEDYVSEERFDKIRFYLEKGKYPPNADRSEKSRLRSATTHYRLEGNKLLLKDKEVISDGHQQYEIAKRIHRQNHGGINKTTALIADKYHWVRIKETVSAVIKNCVECKEHARVPVVRGDRGNSTSPRAISNPPTQQQQQQQQQHQQQQQQQQQQSQQQQSQQLPHPPQSQTQASAAPPSMMPHFDLSAMTTQIPLTGVADMDIPVDPAMMEDVHSISHHHHHPHQQHHHQLAPVAQMHAGRLTMIDGSDGTELTLGDHHNVNSSAHSAEIARAALTEEDRAMRDQLVENLQRIQDANPVNVGNLGGNVAGTHQEMDLDHTL